MQGEIRGPVEKTSTEAASASNVYLPALDGLRAISILLVVVSHGGLARKVPGVLGVLIFFVISGFLITRQMIAEIEKNGSLNLKAFYFRRVLRLAPALLLFIVLFTPLMIAVGVHITPVHVLSGLFYFSNYYQIFVSYPPYNPYPIAWSLSVEEHYYIIFPLAIMLFGTRLKAILPWLYGLLVAVLAWRIALYKGCQSDPVWLMCARAGEVREHGTDAIFDCILYGAIAAIILNYYSATVHRFLLRSSVTAAAILGIIATLIFRDEYFRATIRYSLQCIFIALIIVNILFGPGLGKRLNVILSKASFVFIGRLSYSLYLFHYGAHELIQAIDPAQDFSTIGGKLFYYLCSFVLALLSYYLVEKPMIAVRRRYGAHVKSAENSV